MSSLVDELTGQEVVVFHCMKVRAAGCVVNVTANSPPLGAEYVDCVCNEQSQVRGPSCATRYLAALSRAEEAAAGQEVLVLQGGFERWRMVRVEECASLDCDCIYLTQSTCFSC